MTLSLHVLCWIAVSLASPKLSMLFEARAACLRFRMCEGGERRGKGRGRWRERRRRSKEGDGGGKLQIVWIRDGCFFSIFSNNLTYCYTAAGGLIHSSAGWQYLSGNYRRIFCYLWLSPIIGSQVPQLYAKACLKCRERKSITWVLHMPKDLNINNLLVVPWQNKHLTDFFFLMNHIHVAEPGA